jgi:hypothetical protein
VSADVDACGPRQVAYWTEPEKIILKRIFCDPEITNRAKAIRDWLPERTTETAYAKARAMGIYTARIPQERLDRRVMATKAQEREEEQRQQREVDERLRRQSRSRVADRIPIFLQAEFARWGVA